MTYRELYIMAKNRLTEAGVDSPGFDAAALVEHFLGLSRPALALQGDETPTPQAEAAFLQGVLQRAERRPLQYILGRWPFMNLELKVGEGVLVPREDTAVLVEALAARLRDTPSPKGLDLCAGTGAASLGLCSLIPEAEAACVELDETAFGYLRENLRRYPGYRLRPVRGDVLAPDPLGQLPGQFSGDLDFIISNPPYIAAGELPTLQPEVQQEPALALDGGEDGLKFYRAIAKNWTGLLRPGGILAVEIGESQAQAVTEIFLQSGMTAPQVYRDLAELDRAVLCEK